MVVLHRPHGTIELGKLRGHVARCLGANPAVCVVLHDGARSHTSKAMQEFFDLHADRLTIEQLPASSLDFNPSKLLWKKGKKEATDLRRFPEFTQIQVEMEQALLPFAQTPHTIMGLMARYCASLGTMEA
jgi:hypothetical protein